MTAPDATDRLLETMTWQDAEEAFDGADFVALPCGATEQHSTHLPLSVDTIRAERITRELADAALESGLEIVVLPTLPYGYSEHHMNFSGTITVSQETYADLLVDVGRSLQRHGVSRFLIVNFHGGNTTPIQQASNRLLRDHGLPTHAVNWVGVAREIAAPRFGDDVEIHSSEFETSTMEVYRPDLVIDEKKAPHRNEDRRKTRSYAYIDEISERGGLGDPTQSDPEAMRAVIDETIDAIVADLQSDVARDADERDS